MAKPNFIMSAVLSSILLAAASVAAEVKPNIVLND